MVWISSKPWSGAPNSQSDQWNGYEAERTLIANRISELEVNNLAMIAG
jgi:phosphodiesterase/alkaline phosphatase D-like protein